MFQVSRSALQLHNRCLTSDILSKRNSMLPTLLLNHLYGVNGWRVVTLQMLTHALVIYCVAESIFTTACLFYLVFV